MTDPTGEGPDPGLQRPVPGERRLAHPPSDRYRVAEPAPPPDDPAASVARGVALAVAVALAGAGALTVLGGVLAVSAGLIVVAGAAGWAVAIALRVGAGPRLAPSRRVSLAIGLALASVALGQLGLWAYGRSEGGVLEPLDYLAQVYGPVVILEFAAAWIVAWISAR